MIDMLWKEFSNNILPPSAGAIQRQEMRRAFSLENLETELRQFATAVLEGRA